MVEGRGGKELPRLLPGSAQHSKAPMGFPKKPKTPQKAISETSCSRHHGVAPLEKGLPKRKGFQVGKGLVEQQKGGSGQELRLGNATSPQPPWGPEDTHGAAQWVWHSFFVALEWT